MVCLFVLAIFRSPGAFATEGASRWRAVWHASQALLAGANAADAATSWGKNEANPMARMGQRFSYGSAAIKLAAVAGGLAAEHYIVRKSPAYAPYLTMTNLAAAAGLGAVAAHNATVASPPH